MVKLVSKILRNVGGRTVKPGEEFESGRPELVPSWSKADTQRPLPQRPLPQPRQACRAEGRLAGP
jgi:hypothetical protein